MTRKVYTYYSKKTAKNAPKQKSKKKAGRKPVKKATGFSWNWIKRSFSFIGILGGLIILMVLYNLQYAVIEKDLVEIRQLKKDISYLKNQKTQLLVELKRLKHVNRINKLAKNQLGLVPFSDKPKVLVVDKKLIEEARRKDKELHEQGS